MIVTTHPIIIGHRVATIPTNLKTLTTTICCNIGCNKPLRLQVHYKPIGNSRAPSPPSPASADPSVVVVVGRAPSRARRVRTRSHFPSRLSSRFRHSGGLSSGLSSFLRSSTIGRPGASGRSRKRGAAWMIAIAGRGDRRRLPSSSAAAEAPARTRSSRASVNCAGLRCRAWPSAPACRNVVGLVPSTPYQLTRDPTPSRPRSRGGIRLGRTSSLRRAIVPRKFYAHG